jgi:Pyruvate/2-oxoacid:ferredoxin oxidoreductase gamma subunit
MMPYSVNAQMAEYPDISKLVGYLKSQCKEVVFIEKFPEGVEAVLYNIFLLGRAVKMKDFPLKEEKIKEAINKIVGNYYKENTLRIYNLGVESGMIQPII